MKDFVLKQMPNFGNAMFELAEDLKHLSGKISQKQQTGTSSDISIDFGK